MKFTRELIHIISRNSNWQEDGVQTTLNTNVYANRKSLTKFLQLALLAMGLAFSIAGIIFFFAFNWAHLHKFVKMGMIAALIITCALLSVFAHTNNIIKNIFLTGAALLTGAFIAVYGQVYQTGADSYEFFMAWTIGISVWTVIAGFDVLWILFLVLLHATVILFTQQYDWSFVLTYIILFSINGFFLAAHELLYRFGIIRNQISAWSHKIVSFAAISFITIAIIYCIISSNTFGERLNRLHCTIAAILGILSFTACFFYGMWRKSVFYIAILGVAIISIITASIFEISFDTGSFFLASIVILGGTALLIYQIIQLNKKWNAIQ